MSSSGAQGSEGDDKEADELGKSNNLEDKNPQPNKDPEFLEPAKEAGSGVIDNESKENAFQSFEESPKSPSPENETKIFPMKCPNCSRDIASVTISNQDRSSIQISIKPENEENDEVTSEDNRDLAAATQKKSLWCPSCKINVFLAQQFNNNKQFELNLRLTLNDETKSQKRKPYLKTQLLQRTAGYVPNMWPRVKVYSFNTGDTFGAHESIMAKVRNNGSFFVLVEEQSPEDSQVIIVFCPITSRVGSDVESAMRDQRVSWSDKPVILVLMHHTRDVDYSTGETKWSETYKDVVLEVHVFFHETEPGLLNCQRNDQAMEAVKQKLYSYWKWYS